MAAYTTTAYGAPRSGRFVVGDTVTDANGVVWRCVRSLSPRQWVATNDPLGAGGVVNATTGLTVTEAGNSVMRRTTFTFAATPLTVPDVGQYVGRKIYSFPEGRVLVFGIQGAIQWAVTSDRTATINNNADLVWSLGTATASSTTLNGTMADFLASSSVTLSAAAAAYNTVSKVALTTSTHFDGTNAAKDMFLNAAIVTATNIDADGTIAAQGTISVLWAHYGDA